MSDVTVLRALVTGDDSDLDTVIARSDRKLLDFASKSRPSPRLTITDNTGAVRTRVADLNRDIANLGKSKLNINVGVNIPKNAARDLKDIAGLQLKNSTATITVNRAGNADSKDLRALGRIASELKDKTVTLTVNWQQNGTPPPPLPNGGGPVPPGGRPLPPGGGGRPAPRMGWNDRMDALQSRGYRNVAGGAVLSSVFTRPLMEAGAAVTKFSSEFEENMQHIASLTDVPQSGLADLKKQVLALSDDPRIRQAPIELADALYYVTSTGLKGADAMKVLHASALGASAGLGETKVVANTVTTVLDAYGLGADEAAKVTDTLTEAVRKGKGEAASYAGAFPKVIAIAAQAGVSFQEVAAQMASATRLGLTPSETATALRQLFNNIIDPSEKAKKAMKALGTSVGELRIMLNQKGLFNTLKDLQERTGGRIGPLTELFGNIRALTSFLSTTGNATLQGYKETLEGIEKAHDSTGKSAAIASETLAFQMDRLRAAFQRGMIETGEKVLPKLTPMVEMMGKQLPGAIEEATHAWDALNPTQKKAAIGLLGVLALSGPLKMMAGTVQILGSALGGMAGGFKALGALSLPGNLAGLFGGAGTSVVAGMAVPAAVSGLAIAVAALGVALEVAGIATYDFQAKMGDAANEANTLATSIESVNRHLKNMETVSGSASTATKNALKKLNEDALGAGKNTEKLLSAIREAVAMKVAIGKDMHLDPASKAIATTEIDRLIADLSQRTINLKVNLIDPNDPNSGLKPEVGVQVARARGANLTTEQQTLAREMDWKARAAKAGVPLPAEPPRTIKGMLKPEVGFGFWEIPTEDPNPQYEAQMEARAKARQKILDIEKAASDIAKAEHDEARRNGTAPIKATTQALTEQTKAVDDLTWAEVKHEKARLDKMTMAGVFNSGSPNFDGAAMTRRTQIAAAITAGEEKIQKKREGDLQAAKSRELDAHNARLAALQRTADRERDIEAKGLGDRLQMWNSFGNAVEAVVKQLGVTGAEKTDLQAWALQAQMARREFADIPKPLRDIVVGLGAINDEMKALTSTRDEMRGMFTDLFKDAVRSGADLGPLKEAAAFMEKNLDFERRMKGYYNRGASASKKVIDYTEGQRAGISSRQEALQEAGRSKGDVYSEPGVGGGAAVSIMQGIARQFDGAQTVSACALVAGKMMKAVGINIPQNNSARGLRENAKAMGAHEISMAQAKAGDLINWVGGKYGAGGSGNHVGVYEGGGFYSGNHGKKNVNPMALHEKVSDLARAHFYNTSDFIGGAAKAGQMPASTASTKGVPAVAVKAARPYSPPGAPDYIGSLLQRGIPKGWGKPVTEYGMAPGETRANQFKFQDMVSDTQKMRDLAAQMNAGGSAKALREGTLLNWKPITPDQIAGFYRKLGVVLDTNDALAKGSDEATRRTRDLGRSADFARSGRNNPISEYLYNAGKGDYNRTPKGKREGEFGGLVNMSLAQSAAETREFTRAQDSRNKVLAAGRPFLQGATTDLAAYDRATALAQSRVEAWKDLQGRRDEIASIMDSARAAAKKGDVKTVVARTNQARDLQREHDRLFKMKSEGAANEYDAGTASRAQAELASQQVAAREESELLDYEAGLIAKGVRNQEERSKLVEMEKVRRDTIKRLVDSQPYNSPEQYAQFTAQAEEAARLRGQSIDTQAGNAAGQESRDASDASALKQRLLANQLATAGRYGSDNPELAVQLQLLEERNKLDTDNLTRTNAAKINVDERMKTIEAEIRAEAVLSRYQTERGNLLEAQNGTLDAQKQNELALASTAAERLAIEWKYTDMLRAHQGITTSPEEKAARDEQAQHAAEGERLARYRSEAEAVGSMFHDSIADGFHNGIGAGLRGLGKRIMDAMLEAEFTKVSNRIVGIPTDPNAPTAGGIWGAVMGRKAPAAQTRPEWGPRDGGDPATMLPSPMPAPASIFERLKAGVGGRGLFGENPFIPDARATPTGVGGIGAQVAQAIQGGISAASVVVNSASTEVRGNTVNVSDGGTGFAGFRPTGGGAGSSPDPITGVLRAAGVF